MRLILLKLPHFMKVPAYNSVPACSTFLFDSHDFLRVPYLSLIACLAQYSSCLASPLMYLVTTEM